MPPKPTKPTKPFPGAVRQRDLGCVLTGTRARYGWTAFHAAHVFPLAYEGYWNDYFSGLITVPPATESGGTINSPNNGMLLSAEAHEFFAAYEVSINPDVRNSRSLSLHS